MTDSEKLDLLLSEMQGMKAEMQGMKAEMQDMKAEMQDMKAEMKDIKDRLSVVEDKVSALENKVVNISLHIENVTDKNIQLIAENFIELTKKLNAAIPAADKNLAYEIKVNYLTERVQKLEEQVAELISKTA